MDTTRLRLSLIGPEHLEGFHCIWSNADSTKWNPSRICKTLEDSRKWMSGLLPENNPDGLNYAVSILPTRENEEEQMIGVIGVYSPSPKAELGYTFHPSTWGHGYATEALSAFLELFWEKRPAVKIMEASTDYENYASMKVLTKCGFHEVRRLKGESVTPSKGLEERDAVVFEVEAPSSRAYID